MDGERSGLTLEGLAQKLETQAERLETLERENSELRQEVSALRGPGTRRGEVPALRGSDTRRDKEAELSDALVSRRSLLSKAGAAAVAAVAAGMLLPSREAKADHLDPGISVNFVQTHSVTAEEVDGTFALWGETTSDNAPAVRALNNAAGAAVSGSNEGTGPALEGVANGSGGTGVMGTGRYGVWGETQQAGFYGVWGRNLSTTFGGNGVRGENEAGDGVYGRGKNGGAGVLGASAASGRGAVEGSMENTAGYGVWGNSWGIGVRGTSQNNPGVKGESSALNLGAVEGQNSGTGGIGVRGRGATGVKGVSNTSGRGAVEGSMENASGYGVWGNSWGIGVRGTGTTHGVNGIGTNGYGGLFQGGKAQLRLVPKPAGSVGPPSGSNSKGEIYMDSQANLFVCVASSTATAAARWRKVSTTAV